MSILTVKFLLAVPFSCLTGATPLTCGPLLLPLTNAVAAGGGDDSDDSLVSVDAALAAGATASLQPLSAVVVVGGGLLTVSID